MLLAEKVSLSEEHGSLPQEKIEDLHWWAEINVEVADFFFCQSKNASKISMFIQSPLIYSTHLTETFYRTFNDHVLNKGQGITAISVTKFLNYQLIPNAMIGDKVSYQLFLGNNSMCVHEVHSAICH